MRFSLSKQAQHILVLGLGAILFIALTIIPGYQCPFKMIFGIPCPGCGLTTGFLAILRLDFLEAYQANVLAIPLFLAFVLVTILAITDFIYKKEVLIKLRYTPLSNKTISILIAITAINWAVNILRHLR